MVMAADVKLADGLSSVLRPPGELLDFIVEELSKVGVDLPPLALQIFFLVLVCATLPAIWKRLRARKKADRLPLVAFIAMALIAVGVLLGLVDNLTMPRRVSGRVASDRLADVRVALLDFRDRTISMDAGVVDTSSGYFALHYSPLVNGRARKLRFTAAACKPQDAELSRAQLRAQSEVQWSFQCIAE
jgi:hypothetical protein